MEVSKFRNITKTLIIVVALIILIILPVISVFSKAVIIDGHFSLSLFFEALFKLENLKTIGNSLLLGLLVALLSTLIATPLAFILSRTKYSKSKALDIILLIPFMTPPYISSMGWISFIQRNGLFEQLIPFTGHSIEGLFSLFGLVLIMSLHVFPFLTTLLKNAILNIGPSIDESAKVCGGGFFYRLRRITFPLLTGNYAIGLLLVFIKTLSEYGTPATFGYRIGFKVFTTDIHDYATIAPINFSLASSLSSVLVIICMILWLIQTKITEKKTYKLLGGKGAKRTIYNNKIVNILSTIYLIIIIILAIVIPYFSIISTSLINVKTSGLRFDNLTFDNYIYLFNSRGSLNAIKTSTLMALISATISSLFALILVLLLRKNKKIKKPLMAIATLPEMIPNIVLVLGLMIFWNTIYNIIPVYNTNIFMALVYIVMFLPYGIQYISNSFMQINDSLFNAGRVCGAKKFYLTIKIILPLIFKGILFGWMMIFIIVFRELVASSLVSPLGTRTISTYIVSQFNQGEVGVGMAMAVVCVLISTSALILLNIFSNKSVKYEKNK